MMCEDSNNDCIWDKAILYGLTLRGVPYCRWRGGPLYDGEPAWAGVGPLSEERLEEVFQKGTFCTGLVNLMIREVGGTVPQNHPWNGGTEAYGLAFKEKFYPFSLSSVRRGDLVFRPYFDMTDQGHVAIAMGGENDYVLQCFAWNAVSIKPGVNCDFTLKQSHAGDYYKFIIKREDFWTTMTQKNN